MRKLIKGVNDLASQFPKTALEWSDKNTPLHPDMILAASHKKVWWKGACGHEWKTEVRYRTAGHGCPYCSSNRLLKGFNDLATVYPDLAVEWSDANAFSAGDVNAKSNKKAIWKCKTCGGEWTAVISDRAAGSGCPYCSGARFKTGINDLATRYPDLAAEWSEKNYPLVPERVSVFSRQNVWWKCSSCGFEWQAAIHKRITGSTCPACSGRIVKTGVNDLSITDPDIAKDWDYLKNENLTPSMFTRTSKHMVWWKGACGHESRAKISDRTIGRKGCRVCEDEFEKLLPVLAVLYYTGKQKIKIILNETKIIGLPLDIYLPEQKAAIIISARKRYSDEGMRNETIKNELCIRKGIQLIRLLRRGAREIRGCVNIECRSNSDACLGTTVSRALQQAGISISINLSQDREKIRNMYDNWKCRLLTH